jgi:diguanylate cyclase (GGDEF)-like protein
MANRTIATGLETTTDQYQWPRTQPIPHTRGSFRTSPLAQRLAAAVIVAGIVLGCRVISMADASLDAWRALFLLASLATFAQLYYPANDTPGPRIIHPCLFAGLLCLPPFLFVLLVLIPHICSWLVVRRQRGHHPIDDMLLAFRAATQIIAGAAALGILGGWSARASAEIITLAEPAVLLAVALYVSIDLGLDALVFLPIKQTPQRKLELWVKGWLGSYALTCLGYLLGLFWQIDRGLVLLALLPMALIYRSSRLPELQQEAYKDVKTGLWNAGYFGQAFATVLRRAERTRRPVGVIMADLDWLRRINNTYGHLAGDAVLAGVGQIIQKHLHESDLAARFGGEEFAIALPEMGLQQARLVAEQLRRAIAGTRFYLPACNQTVQVTMSFGVSCSACYTTEPISLLHEADLALYQAKQTGRNRVVCVSEIS